MENDPTFPSVERTLSVMLTFACSAECRDCGTISSPRNRHNLAIADVLRGLDEAARLQFHNVVFTGGEATLRWGELLIAIRHATALGLPTRLVTNAHWAKSLDDADARLGVLLEAGLKEINFSTGDEHVRFVPLDHVINAAVATVRQGLTAYIMVELRSEPLVTRKSILSHRLVEQLPLSLQALIKPSESPWMPLDPGRVASYPEGIAATKENLSNCLGCDSVLQTYVMQADGRIGACCGLGMRMIKELNVGRVEGSNFLEGAIRDAGDDFLKIWLRYKGPEKILAWAAKHDPEIKWEGMYGHRCQACIRLYRDARVRRVIARSGLEMMPEVIQSAWLQEQYIPSKLSGKAVP
jgi:radical SAM family protein